MSLSKDEALALKALVEKYGHFVVDLKKTYWLHLVDDPEIMQFREFFRENVLLPLIAASNRAIVYDCECARHDFDHNERAKLEKILVKKGSVYEINLTNDDDIVRTFPDFWADTMYDIKEKKRYARGSILFFIDDQRMDFSQLFSQYSSAYVVNNLAGALGRSLFNRAKKYVKENPDRTVIALFNGTKLIVFPGRDVVKKRVEQAIDAIKSAE